MFLLTKDSLKTNGQDVLCQSGEGIVRPQNI